MVPPPENPPGKQDRKALIVQACFAVLAAVKAVKSVIDLIKWWDSQNPTS